MGAERQTKERGSRGNIGRAAAAGLGKGQTPPTNGKVSIAHLVEEGLLTPGNVVVCNSWPFSAVVTKAGKFNAQWTPTPKDHVAGVGSEFMRTEFETPSAWATAVCRVVRAQARAQQTAGSPTAAADLVVMANGRGARAKAARAAQSGSATGESRVAVNGWTACRVQIPHGDPNHKLALQLDGDAERVAAEDATAEVMLDALRRELLARISRRGRAPGRRSQKGQQRQEARRSLPAMTSEPRTDGKDDPAQSMDAHGSESDPEQQPHHVNAELQEITGAVDGLAQRVERGLALGCVSQRRAAAAAADAISAASSTLLPSLERFSAQLGGSVVEGYARTAARRHKHSRKRKSNPDMSRHAKLSRVPTDDSDASDVADSDGSGGSRLARFSSQTSNRLEFYRDCADSLKYAHPELKALRYQRKQTLKRRIVAALDIWLHHRRRRRGLQPGSRLLQNVSAASLAQFPNSQSPVQMDAISPAHSAASAFPQPLPTDATLEGVNMPALCISSVRLPSGCISRNSVLPQLCTLCGSTGQLIPCQACGDRYHSFCAEAVHPRLAFQRAKFVCPACRVCTRCLGSTADGSCDNSLSLLQCDDCGIHMHAHCSAQRSQHRDGLAAAVAENGRWLCDDCVHCCECGFAMQAAESHRFGDPHAEGRAAVEWRLQVSWAFDFTVCGQCAQHIERGRVCPVCVATHSNNSKISNNNMVCCDICAFWVHADCDPTLTSDVYDALITLEDAPYVCPMCSMTADGSSNAAALMLESSLSVSDSSDAEAIPATLPQCLRLLVDKPIAESLVKDPPVSDVVKMLSLESNQITPCEYMDPSTSSISSPSGDAKSSQLSTDIEAISAKHEPETEVANLLLSLTQSDIRFGRDRFSVEALEARYCVSVLTDLQESGGCDDWRCCVLCGLHGDGASESTQPSALGRLISLHPRPCLAGEPAENPAACYWVHVECLAWAWGPRPVSVDASSASWSQSRSLAASPGMGAVASTAASTTNTARLVQFEGSLQLPFDTKDALLCTLCGRTGASFHCCAPVPCFDTAYHLPCLLLSGSPSPHLSQGHEQYCAAWRRALCATHAPVFSAMMPANGAIESPTYANVRVEGCVDSTATNESSANSPASLVAAETESSNTKSYTLIGSGLLVVDWGRFGPEYVEKAQWSASLPPRFHCIRVFKTAGKLCCIGIGLSANGEASQQEPLWRGWVQRGIPDDFVLQPWSVSADSLSNLLEQLFETILTDLKPLHHPLAMVLARIARENPLAFLGISRCNLQAHLSANVPGYTK
ncbi:hypothetical protein COEREDRAFT_11153 [Coemansia reversa NRRL 1564]|uniref:PHD-type domain-containing protein n=1 Tax=Coemansia reversa (strain ATCC 12441 / NRRL 1564) TaxID=763665 RepID=A0A2G5B3P6_COERN|nr:hypothetical protein COEREDRAFT_11153 [Coemansia reversa NRRL 1564]|eukprot:PIA13638.1 hypothetical protein COEREDRAFT_11153 [Coemansia reversa NRRL 1564]